MKASEIKVGHTYANRGKGKVTRTVLAIGLHSRPNNIFLTPGVLYRDSRGKERRLYLSSFASWAGRDVTEETQ